MIQNDRFVTKHSVGFAINRVIYSHVGRKVMMINERQPITEHVALHHVPELLWEMFLVKMVSACQGMDGN